VTKNSKKVSSIAKRVGGGMEPEWGGIEEGVKKSGPIIKEQRRTWEEEVRNACEKGEEQLLVARSGGGRVEKKENGGGKRFSRLKQKG